MTTPERIHALVEAVAYIERRAVEGAMVECGVWMGGSAMAMALAMLHHGQTDRDIYLYDTFAGMSAPTSADVSVYGEPAGVKFAASRSTDGASDWCRAPLDEVRTNVLSTDYPADRVHFIEGKVEETIPGRAPERIALLRLDTDWYESTRHELEHLYPRLSRHGVLIIDDYGHWQGARKAVDEYFERLGQPVLLHRIDKTCRVVVKTGG
jgi:predicted O-methyltransferase YrrM